jgi:hypothetical protein
VNMNMYNKIIITMRIKLLKSNRLCGRTLNRGLPFLTCIPYI